MNGKGPAHRRSACSLDVAEAPPQSHGVGFVRFCFAMKDQMVALALERPARV